MVKSSGQNDQYPFGWRVFSAWDFLITERETADNKLASLTTAIKVDTELDYYKLKQHHCFYINFYTIAFMNLLCFIIYNSFKKRFEYNSGRQTKLLGSSVVADQTSLQV